MSLSCGFCVVYKEIGLKDVDLDIWYANAWISFYQILLGLVTIWTTQVSWNYYSLLYPPSRIYYLVSIMQEACAVGPFILFHSCNVSK
jgi:hypothetical protein